MLPQDIGYFIKVIDDKIKASATAGLKSYGLTFTQSRVLSYLRDRGGQATQKEIQTFLEVSHPTVVGLIARMEQAGFVSSQMDEKDNRNKIVRLETKADSIGDRLDECMAQNESRLLDGLTEAEVAELRRLLSKVYKNL